MSYNALQFIMYLTFDEMAYQGDGVFSGLYVIKLARNGHSLLDTHIARQFTSRHVTFYNL